MHCCGANSTVFMPSIECHSEQDVRRFRSAIRNERGVSGMLKIGITQIHVRIAVSRRRKVDQAPAFADKRGDPVHKDEMAQVIGTEWRLKAVRRVTERRRHYSGVSDDHVQRFSFGKQFVGTRTYAL